MIQGLGLVRNPYTLGVRVLVLDAKDRVLLVRHSYLEGWYLPGGGVDRGETMVEAACREVLEEAGISTSGEPVLMNVYLNEEATGRDHVGLFLVSEWTEAENYLSPNAEIVEAAFSRQGTFRLVSPRQPFDVSKNGWPAKEPPAAAGETR